jgi:nitrogen fixation NifU-like protein
MMYSEKLLQYFRDDSRSGTLPPPAITVEVSNPACGDILRLSALWQDGRIEQVRFQVRGCTASIAAASALCSMMEGRTGDQMRGITAEAIERELDGLPPASRHAAVLCMDGLKKLLAAAR